MNPKPTAERSLSIFPASAKLGKFGNARLARVERTERGPHAIYAIEPGDAAAFREGVSALRDQFNLTYQPIPALWGSWRLPDSDDDLMLQIGIDAAAGKARTEAIRALKSKATSVVSEAEVKALALGYLLRAGAEV